MKIMVNGKSFETGQETSLAQVIESLGGLREGMAVARNMEVVPRQELQSVVVQEGDSLEIIQAVGGG